MTFGPSPPSKPVRSDKSSLEYVTSLDQRFKWRWVPKWWWCNAFYVYAT